MIFNSLSGNIRNWRRYHKSPILPTNCLSVFDHVVGLALKELKDEAFIFFEVYSPHPWISKTLVKIDVSVNLFTSRDVFRHLR